MTGSASWGQQVRYHLVMKLDRQPEHCTVVKHRTNWAKTVEYPSPHCQLLSSSCFIVFTKCRCRRRFVRTEKTDLSRNTVCNSLIWSVILIRTTFGPKSSSCVAGNEFWIKSGSMLINKTDKTHARFCKHVLVWYHQITCRALQDFFDALFYGCCAILASNNAQT